MPRDGSESGQVTAMARRASIVINTYNRAASLEQTLRSLRYLDHPDFEVIVVNGPSTDSTDDVLKRWSGDIKIGVCTKRNISVSRNIGIAMAAGEIVAFMDDDAIPEPEWLSRLAAGYDEEEVGGVGGSTYDHTGYEFQARYIINDRFGGGRFENDNPTPYFNFPHAQEYCGFMGTNASFRRDVLVRIGGYDEEYEYYLDETDVCARMVDKGHIARYVDNAFMHHKFLPSHVRNEHRIVTNWFSLIKNKAYFAVKNASSTHTFKEIAEQVFRYVDQQHAWVESSIKDQLIPESQLGDFDATADRAMRVGFERGLGQPRKQISAETLKQYKRPFRRFPTIILGGDDRLSVCYLTEFYPPGFYGGIARFTKDLAQGLARKGHNVHVITHGEDHNTVDFEDDVWVHRIVPREFDPPDIPKAYPVSRKNYNYSRTVYEEVKRIDSHHRIDLIEAPIWGTEGYHCILDEGFRDRTIVSLHTTTKIASEGHQAWLADPDILKVIETEEFVLRNARSFLANSHAIVEKLRQEYGVEIPGSCMGLVPHGVKDLRARFFGRDASGDGITILFVGRMEPRKGADVLLKVIPGILKKHPHARFVLVGEDSISNEHGIIYKDEFLRKHQGEPFLERVEFTGHIDEEELYQRYADCDIFVAPSRYESFGLIFLEAMMFGKPVVGCSAGGMLEVIEPGGNGFLAEPGDQETLREAIERLIEDDELRNRFGTRSRQIYEERFTDAKMTDAVLNFYMDLISAVSS